MVALPAPPSFPDDTRVVQASRRWRTVRLWLAVRGLTTPWFTGTVGLAGTPLGRSTLER
jgi:hypothetical protein